MKKKVIKFFQNLPQEKHEQFNQAFELYRMSDGKNLGTERTLNAAGFSERALENLLYDLQKMHGITDVEKVISGQMAVVSDQAESEENKMPESEKANVENENEDLKNELEELHSDKEDLEYEKDQLEVENEELKSANESLKALSLISAKSVRVEFPFLAEKDCPDELKILVADKITAWNRYVDVQAAIAKHHAGDAVSESDLAELAKIAVDSFDENQKIYEELNCYATFGRVLGIHPIFKKLQLSREVEIMTADELIAYKGSSAKYFSVNKTALAKAEKAKDLEKVTEITNRVAERSEKLFLVNKKLGVKNK
jgi:hypothetical protein